MYIEINGYKWRIVYTADRNNLSRSDGTLALGVTDTNEKCIYIYRALSRHMEQKVLTHELVHAWIFSYNLYLDIDQEEFVCDFVATYGRDIISQADMLLNAGIYAVL